MDAASLSDTTKREGAGLGGFGGVGLNFEEGMGPMQEKGSPVCEVTRSGEHARVAAGLRPRAFSAPGPPSG